MANYVSGLLYKKEVDGTTGQPTGTVTPILVKTTARNVILDDGRSVQTVVGNGLTYQTYASVADYQAAYAGGTATNILGIIPG